MTMVVYDAQEQGPHDVAKRSENFVHFGAIVIVVIMKGA